MKEVALGTIVEIKGGGTPSRDNDSYWGGEIPWASVKDFRSSAIDKTQESITPAGLANSASNLIPAGAILVPTRMAVGKSAITTIDLAINQDLKALLPSPDVESRYLLHHLLSSASLLERRASGATVKGITLDVLRDLPIKLPSKDEQRRLLPFSIRPTRCGQSDGRHWHNSTSWRRRSLWRCLAGATRS